MKGPKWSKVGFCLVWFLGFGDFFYYFYFLLLLLLGFFHGIIKKEC